MRRAYRIFAIAMTVLMMAMLIAPYSRMLDGDGFAAYAAEESTVAEGGDTGSGGQDAEPADAAVEVKAAEAGASDAAVADDPADGQEGSAAAPLRAAAPAENADENADGEEDEAVQTRAALPDGVCMLESSGECFDSLDKAFTAAQSTDTIMLFRDVELSATLTPPTKNLTLTTADIYAGSGEDGKAVIRRASGFASSMISLNNVNKSLTFRDITLDGRDASGKMIAVNGDGALCYVTAGRLTLDSGAVLQYGHAGGNGGQGGAIYVTGTSSRVLMKDGCVIQDCRADRNVYYAGGAVCVVDINNGNYQNNPEGFHMAGGTIRRCGATATSGNGGSGGAIGVDHHDTIRISGGLITDCRATNRGGAIESHGTVDMAGGTITKCHSANGGAINFYRNGNDDNDANDGDEAIIIFSGSPKIYGNYNDSKPDQACNVDIYHHYTGDAVTCANIRIRTTTEELKGDAMIGIYAGEFEEKGRFGIYRQGAALTHLECFTNDRDPSLVGTDGGNQTFGTAAGQRNNGILVWGKGIKTVARFYTEDPSDSFEIAGSDGRYYFDYNIGNATSKTVEKEAAGYAGLYIAYKDYSPMIDAEPDFRFARVLRSGETDELSADLDSIRSTVTISGAGNNRSWSYYNEYKLQGQSWTELGNGDTVILYYKVSPVCKITDAEGNILCLSSGNPALFAKLETALAKSGDMWTVGSDGVVTRYSRKSRAVRMLVSEYEQKAAATAEGNYELTLTTETETPADGLFAGPGGSAVIKRGASVGDAPMISDSLTGSEGLVLASVILRDESGDASDLSVNGAAIQVSGSGAKLAIEREALIDGFRTARGNGGAVWLGDGTQMKMKGEITNCAAVNGGAIYMDGSSTLALMDQASLRVNGGPTEDEIETVKGGAVYAGSGAVINMNGKGSDSAENVQITNSHAKEKGSGIFLGSGATLNMNAGTINSCFTNTEGGGGLYLSQGSRFNVSGSPYISSEDRVEDRNATSNKACDVVLETNAASADEIHMTGDLAADINIWAAGEKHDGEGEQFAVTADRKYRGCEHFINQKDSSLFGTLSEKNTSDSKIYWGRGFADLKITKKTEGAYADMTREFSFSISLPDNGGKAYTAVRYAAGENGDEEVETLSLSGDCTFGLKNDEYIVIKDVLCGSEIKLQETGEKIGSETGRDGCYKVTADLGDSDTYEAAALRDGDDRLTTVRFMMKSDMDVTVTNELEQTPVDSGVDGGSTHVLVMFALILAAAEAYILHRRRIVRSR